MAADNTTTLQIQVTAQDDTTRVLKGVESGVIRFVGAVSAALAAVRVVIFPINEAKEFERELLNVGKTTEYSSAQLKELGEDLKEVSQRLNVSEVDLAKVAAAGGQLGIGAAEGVQGLVTFTEAAARFSSVLDVSVEQAANGIGKLSNIFKIAIADAERISSLLNEVSNNSTASGEDLLDIIQRIGTASGTLGLTQAAALAATGRDLGLTVETIGTSFNKIFLDLQTKSEDVANLIGLPVEEFSRILQTDGIQALQLYVSALAKLPATQRAALSESITGGGRIAALVTSLVNDANTGYALLTRNLDSANRGFNEGTSAIREQGRVLQGLEAQITILGNVILSTAERIGSQALPYLNDLGVAIQEFVKSDEAVAAFQEFASVIGAAARAAIELARTLTGAVGGLRVLVRLLEVFIAFKLVGAVASIVTSFSRYTAGIVNTARAYAGLITAQKAAVTQIAAATAEANKSGAAQLTLAGRAATVLNGLFGARFAQQDELARQLRVQSEAEQELANIKKSSTAAIAVEKAEQQRLNAIIRQRGRDVRESSLAAGRSAAQANADAEASVRANRNILLASKLRTEEIRRTTAAQVQSLTLTKAQAAAEATRLNQAIAGTSRLGIVANATAVAVGRVFRGLLAFVGVVSSILAVVTVVSLLLDYLGLLEPLLAGIATVFGTSSTALAQAQREAAERSRELEEEKTRVDQLAERYDVLKKTIGGPVTPRPGSVSLTLQEIITNLEIVEGKLANLSFSDNFAESSGTAAVDRVKELVQQLEEAEAEYARLQTRVEQFNNLSGNISGSFPVLGGSLAVSEEALQRQEQQILAIKSAIENAVQAEDAYSTTIERNAEARKEAALEEMQLLGLLQAQYNAEGAALIQKIAERANAEKQLQEAIAERNKLEQQGRDVADSGLNTPEYDAAQQSVVLLTAEVDTLREAYKKMVAEATLAGVLFQTQIVPDSATQDVDALNAAVSRLRIISGEALEDLQKEAVAVQQALEASEETMARLERERLARVEENERERQLTISRISVFLPENSNEAGKQRELVNEQYDKLEAQINKVGNAQRTAALRDIADQKTRLSLLRGQIDLTNQFSRETNSLARATESNNRIEAAKIFSLAGQAKALKDVVEQQRIVRDGAKDTAEGIKSAYEKAQKAVEDSIGKALDGVIERQNFIIERNNILAQRRQSNEFDKREDQIAKDEERRLDILKESLEAEGESQDIIDAILDRERELNEEQAKRRQASRDEAEQKLRIQGINTQLVEGQRQINELLEKAAELTAKSEQAKKLAREADNEAVRNAQTENASKFAEDAVTAADRATQGVEQLKRTVSEYKEEAKKPIDDSSGTPRFLITQEQVDAAVALVEQFQNRVLAANRDTLKEAKQATTDNATLQNNLLEEETQRLSAIEKQLAAFAKVIPDLQGNISDIGEKVLSAANASGQIDTILKSISNTDLSNLSQTDALSRNAQAAKEIADAMDRIGKSLAGKVNLATGTSALSEEIGNAAGLSDKQLAANKARLEAAVNVDGGVQASVSFPNARQSAQEALNAGGPLTADLSFIGGPGGVQPQSNAEGGYIQGPGTSTSDSILSWLSNGEYVIDALTTRTLGPGFFAALQALARGSKGMLGSMLGSLGRFGLPAFASGGFVAPSPRASSDAAGFGGAAFLQPLLLSIGGETVETFTSARGGQEVTRLVRKQALKKGTRASLTRKL